MGDTGYFHKPSFTCDREREYKERIAELETENDVWREGGKENKAYTDRQVERADKWKERAEKAETERNGWEKAARECAGHCHDYCLSRIELEAQRDVALDVCRNIEEFAGISIGYIETADDLDRFELVAQLETIRRFAKKPLDD